MSSQTAGELAENLTNLSNGNLAAIAALTLLAYDWLCCLEREIQHYWGSRIRTGTVLYYIIRILPLVTAAAHITSTVVDLPSNVQVQICKPYVISIGILETLSFTVMQAILALRTWALFEKSNRLFSALIVVILSSVAVQFYTWLGPHYRTVINLTPAPYTGCLIVGLKHSYIRYLPLLVFEVLVLVLTTSKFIVYLKNDARSKLSSILYRDGFIGFCGVAVATSLGIVIQVIGSRDLRTFGLILTPVVPAVLAAHLLLNIKDAFSISHELSRPHPVNQVFRFPPAMAERDRSIEWIPMPARNRPSSSSSEIACPIQENRISVIDISWPNRARASSSHKSYAQSPV